MFTRFEFNLHVLWAMITYSWLQLSNWIVSLVPLRHKNEHSQINWPISADMRGKVVIITGSNTGIGRAAAEQLGQFGATVVLACRDVKRGRIAEDEVNRSLLASSRVDFPFAEQGKAVFMALDLGDLHKVWEFTIEFRKAFSHVDVLINNAGLNVDEVLPNGLKQLFQVNYLGHYLLFRCLQDMLATGSGRKDEEAGRVINLSSVMHHCGHPNFKVSALSAISSAFTNASSPYDDSKLYMNLFTMEINRRFSEGGAAAVGNNTPRRSTRSAARFRRPLLGVSANPGAVLSDIWRHLPFQTLIRAIFQLFFLNTVQGSATSVYAAIVEEDVIRAQLHPTGEFFSNTGGRMLFHRYLPYLIPYAMPTRSLANEVMGPFAGPRFSYASLPSRSDYFPIQSISRLSHNQRSFSGNSLASISDDSTASGADPPINSRAATRMIEFGTSEELASQLWRYSAHLCHKVLALSGLSEDELAFLRDEL